MKFKNDPSTITDDIGYLVKVFLAPVTIVIGVGVCVYATSPAVKDGSGLNELGRMLVLGAIGGANFSGERSSRHRLDSSTSNPPDDYEGEI